MKRKILLLIFMLVCAVVCLAGCASCSSCDDGGKNGGAEPHTHIYDCETAEQKYLKSAATCTGRAVYYYSCACGQRGEDTFEYGDVGEHIFNTYVSDNNATCEEDGTETAKCSSCGKTDTRTVKDSKTGHSFKIYVSDDNATCIKNCTETAKCENCPATDTRSIPKSKLKHVFLNYIPDGAATCVKDGTATATCENCRFATNTIILSGPLGHIVAEYVSDNNATCTENATESGICERCGDTVRREIADSKLPHSFIEYSPDNNATCIKNGTESTICIWCAVRDVREIADSKLPHTFINYVSDNNGSCTENCTETAVCESCRIATDVREKANSRIHLVFNHKCKLCGETCGTEGLEYTLNADGVSYSLTGIGTATDTALYISSTYNGLPVTTIRSVGYNCITLFIPYSITNIITEINEDAFSGCRSLYRITVDEDNENYKSVDGNLYSKDGTEFIRYSAGKAEKEFTLPDEVTDINTFAFISSGLQTVTIPDSVISIGRYVFSYCNKLKRVNISCSVTSIMYDAFEGCSALEEITVDESNEYYKSIDGNLYSKDGTKIIKYSAAKGDTAFVIPESVTVIGGYAFDSCNNLIYIEIPDRVNTIGESAFQHCKNLKSIEIPTGVDRIAYWMLCGCAGLESVIIPGGITNIGQYAFLGCNALKSVYYCGTEEQWNAIWDIGYNSALTEAAKYFYSEAQPEGEGNFWHYGENGEVAVW